MSRPTADPSLPELIRLCERVLAADISEGDLLRAWPERPDDPQLSELRETLLTGLDHLPGRLVDGAWRLDRAVWRTMPEHKDVEFFLRRLRHAARRSPRGVDDSG